MGIPYIHRVLSEKYVKTKEPPYTERYVRWCGRSVDKIIIYLLPDFYERGAVVIICQLMPHKPEKLYEIHKKL